MTIIAVRYYPCQRHVFKNTETEVCSMCESERFEREARLARARKDVHGAELLEQLAKERAQKFWADYFRGQVIC